MLGIVRTLARCSNADWEIAIKHIVDRRAFLIAGAGICIACKAGWAQSTGPAAGRLIAIGGGHVGAPIRQALRRYGGDRWVMVPTASPDQRIGPNPPRWMGANAILLHTRDRALANSESFVAPLGTATAVFFGGGRQYLLVDAYAGTLTEKAFRGVLDRGGLIAGTSAGATIQGSYLVRGAPSEDNSILMYPGYERGFGYLSNVAIDQHVDVRNRINDLAQVIARYPSLLGIGLDQGTGILVERNIMTILGPDRVYITQATQPLSSLTPGMRFDIANRRLA